MIRVTTCPACGTMFNIQPDALAAHGGEGRCSVCHHVFNALEHMSLIEPVTPTAIPAAPQEDATNADHAPAPMLDELAPDAASSTVPPESDVHIPEFSPIDLPETLFQKKRLPWSALLRSFSLATLLLLAALVQTSLLFKHQIIHHAPSLYPALSALCQAFSCSVMPPNQAKLIVIEDYHLRSHPDYDDVLILESTLHNRAAFPLAYPLLQLTLTDDFNAPVATRTFLPADYLPAVADQHQGIHSNAYISIQLHLGVTGIKSSKYKLLTQDMPPPVQAAEEIAS